MGEASFARHALEIDGGTLHYSESGAGEAIVCLDGMLGLRPSRAHALLAERNRVLVLDVCNTGAEDVPHLVGAALDRLGLAKVSLIGHGIGASVALRLGLARPDAVGTILIIAPTALDADRDMVPEAALKAALHAHPERHPDPPHASRERRALARRLRKVEAEALAQLAPPVLALFGNSDPIAPPESADRYRAALRECGLMFVYDAGHAVDLDRAEAVAFIAREFFERGDQFLVNRDSGVAFP